MGAGPELLTERLLLRRWRARDRAPFAALNADPEVNEFLTGPLTRAESDALLARLEAGFERDGFGLWALERRADGEFLGSAGIAPVPFDAPFTPAVEVGWRLARPAWGHGYATEAARAALGFGFGPAGLDEVVAMTAVGNARSRAVMERLGMSRDPREDFEHPGVPPGSPLRPHVLYRISGPEQGPRRPA
jgi:RimJ/RimL family protein N-acetyltransferase